MNRQEFWMLGPMGLARPVKCGRWGKQNLEVRVTASVDVRGTLGMESDVSVSFQSMSCDITLRVKEGTPSRIMESLQAAAQRCCVVQQTLHHPPPVITQFRTCEGSFQAV
jgi:hypothetical protein